LQSYFPDARLRSHKPFTAVAEGALLVGAGIGLDDFLAYSYGLRHLEAGGGHAYEEILVAGSSYPTARPIEVRLAAAHDGQTAMEFIVGQIDIGGAHLLDVRYEDGRPVFVADSAGSGEQIIALNEADAEKYLASLEPPGHAGEERVKALFRIDEQRRLYLTVVDLQSNKELVHDAFLATLR
jgi:hypothetical protein